MKILKKIVQENPKVRNANLVFVVFWASLSLIGHAFNIPLLTQVLGGSVDMKLPTTLMFMFVCSYTFSRSIFPLGS